ncbi:ankyrin repeat protein, putative [Trichomonas vaginalis G3]|uniref:Ankyrin repeat protein, putative n=1 Tax=Trichomonas vaginalis (strain ATCC PRA-98 / G3) TaxID=412133 RepID=A2DIT7_TRIV3|nr:spectrin binding [Trichomonas vaginalis G3]EAY19700.1 ankyrin repeat protein, putative [Trichomonas vaginalis G3]KAI5521280.1 spectrin binding [Trichomonas vaginalis G3]|eukprot:XP_001580686.1 ankyrin repeat protein [Trichomonas vaginalis G3]
MELCKDYGCACNTIYKLKASTDDEITRIYQDIKNKMIETDLFLPTQLITMLFEAAIYNRRYFDSYWIIFKKIYEEYHPLLTTSIKMPFLYLTNKEYGINSYQNCQYNIENQKNLLFCHQDDPTYKAIMDDDKEKFILIIEQDGFNQYQKFRRNSSEYSLIELCCFYGAVDCFKLLRTKFKSKITNYCLRFSFLSGKPDIMSECLKFQKPDQKCMKYAIISHNIDFVTFLMNEYNIPIDVDYCIKYNNIEAFLVLLDQTQNIKQSLVYASGFDIPSLCEYLTLHNADVNEKLPNGLSPIIIAARQNSYKVAEILFNYGASIEAQDDIGKTPLINAAMHGNLETLKFLISHGSNVNATYQGINSLFFAASLNHLKIAELLISHGIDLNHQDRFGDTVLHQVTHNNQKDFVTILVSHGADVNIKNHYGKTPIQGALESKEEIYKLLIKHGAKVTLSDRVSRFSEFYINHKYLCFLLSYILLYLFGSLISYLFKH